MDDVYDLIVIGSGPAGEKGAAQAAYFGKRVAMIEKSMPVGGVCVHWGTLPSKSLRESAQHLSGLKVRGVAGLESLRSQTGVKIQTLLAHKRAVSASEVERIEKNLDRHGIELIHGTARLDGPDTVVVAEPGGGERVLTTRFVLIATGTRPWRPTHLPFDTEQVWDSDEILEIDRVPESMIVVGAGVIGCEYAAMFSALGVEVTVIEPRGAILPFLDGDIRKRLMEAFDRAGINFHFGETVTGARIEDDGKVTATLEGGGEVTAEKLLFAAGRSGNTESLGLESAGVEVNRRGQIMVDEQYRTACPTVYAAGDVIGFPALASTSMEQARVGMCHAFGFAYKTKLTSLLPYGIYTIPEVSMIGDTEEAVQEREEPYEIGIAYYKDNARGKICGHTDGMIKLVFQPESKNVLGVHIVGENAAELVHIGLTVMQLGGTIDTFIDACYNYPTLSECYKYAAYDGLGRLARRA